VRRRAFARGAEADRPDASPRVGRRHVSDVSGDATGVASRDLSVDTCVPGPGRPIPLRERPCVDRGFPKSIPAHEARS
jgi:hypothetical protein